MPTDPVSPVPHDGAVRTVSRTRPRTQLMGGAALGLLLGTLVGLSATPIVMIVVTALVALLAGIFGLSDKFSTAMPADATRRLIGFGVMASIATPLGIWARTSEFLAPSVGSQIETLVAMGVTDKQEQKDLLKLQRFGIVPAGVSINSKDAEAIRQVATPALYADSSTFCANLTRLRDAASADYLTLLASGPTIARRASDRISKLPEDRRRAALEAAWIYLCD